MGRRKHVKGAATLTPIRVSANSGLQLRVKGRVVRTVRRLKNRRASASLRRMSLRPVLLAEDEADDRALFKRVFQGCRVKNPLVTFDDGEGVMKYLESDRGAHPLPVILFLDLKMKRMDGLEVLRYVGAHSKGQFPVIVLTGME